MNRNLNSKIREWADQHRPTPQHTDQLADAIIDSWQQRSTAAIDSRRKRSLLWGIAVAIAASLVALLLLRPDASRSNLDQLISSEEASFQQETSRLSRLFREAEALFGKQLHWISQNNNTTELGLATTPPPGTPLTLRFTLVARPEEGSTWQRLWTTDLIARDDNYLEISPDSNPDNTIKLWMHLLNNNQLFIESQLQLVLSNQKRATTSASEILSLGKVHTAAEIILNNTRYLLLQSANSVNISHQDKSHDA